MTDGYGSLLHQVIRDKWTGKTKGYGFVSFANASDLAAALKEMNGMSAFSPLMHPFPVTSVSTATYKTKCHAGKYVGNRPIKLRKSTWKNRIDFEALEKGKVSSQLFPLFWPHPVFFYMYHVLTFVVLIFHRLNHRRKSNRRKEVFFTSETDKLCMFIVAVSISEKVV